MVNINLFTYWWILTCLNIGEYLFEYCWILTCLNIVEYWPVLILLNINLFKYCLILTCLDNTIILSFLCLHFSLLICLFIPILIEPSFYLSIYLHTIQIHNRYKIGNRKLDVSIWLDVPNSYFILNLKFPNLCFFPLFFGILGLFILLLLCSWKVSI